MHIILHIQIVFQKSDWMLCWMGAGVWVRQQVEGVQVDVLFIIEDSETT